MGDDRLPESTFLRTLIGHLGDCDAVATPHHTQLPPGEMFLGAFLTTAALAGTMLLHFSQVEAPAPLQNPAHHICVEVFGVSSSQRCGTECRQASFPTLRSLRQSLSRHRNFIAHCWFESQTCSSQRVTKTNLLNRHVKSMLGSCSAACAAAYPPA
eukprot:6205048-Pleurochrysis_carterae.AAC.6